MWDPEHCPGADNVPWQLLIRARYQYQIDARIASTVISTFGRLAPQGIAAKLSDAAAELQESFGKSLQELAG